MLRRRSKIILVVLIIIAVGIFVLLGIIRNMESNLEALKRAEIGNIDLTMLEDGDYPGHYSAFPIDVELIVAVRDNIITDIELLKHTNGQGKPAEAIIKNVLESQTLELDAISGATYSSKVILKAIENAIVTNQE